MPSSERVWDDQSREMWEGPLTAVKASKEWCSNVVVELISRGAAMAVSMKSVRVGGGVEAGGAG